MKTYTTIQGDPITAALDAYAARAARAVGRDYEPGGKLAVEDLVPLATWLLAYRRERDERSRAAASASARTERAAAEQRLVTAEVTAVERARVEWR